MVTPSYKDVDGLWGRYGKCGCGDVGAAKVIDTPFHTQRRQQPAGWGTGLRSKSGVTTPSPSSVGVRRWRV